MNSSSKYSDKALQRPLELFPNATRQELEFVSQQDLERELATILE